MLIFGLALRLVASSLALVCIHWLTTEQMQEGWTVDIVF